MSDFVAKLVGRFVDDEDFSRTGRVWVEVRNGAGRVDFPLTGEQKEAKRVCVESAHAAGESAAAAARSERVAADGAGRVAGAEGKVSELSARVELLAGEVAEHASVVGESVKAAGESARLADVSGKSAGEFATRAESAQGVVQKLFDSATERVSAVVAELVADAKARVGALVEAQVDVARAHAEEAKKFSFSAGDSDIKAMEAAGWAVDHMGNAERYSMESKTARDEAFSKLSTWDKRWPELLGLVEKYEWLKENAPTLKATITQAMESAAESLQKVVAGDRAAMQRSASEAAQSKMKAEAAAKRAEAQVMEEINRLKGSVPEAFDTLEEIAERIKQGGTLEAELLVKIAEKLPRGEFEVLKERVDALKISDVSGLADALAGKAPKAHKHTLADVSGLPDRAVSTIVANTVMVRDDNARSSVQTPTEKAHIANKQYVDDSDAPLIRRLNALEARPATWVVTSPASYGTTTAPSIPRGAVAGDVVFDDRTLIYWRVKA